MLQGSSAEFRRGQRAKVILFLVLALRMGLVMKRLWEGGGVVVCVVVVGVVGEVGGRWSQVAHFQALLFTVCDLLQDIIMRHSSCGAR